MSETGKFMAFTATILIFFIVMPYLFGGSANGISLATAGVFAGKSIGMAFGVLVLGCIGLLYKPDRFAGFAVTTLIVTLFFLKGTL